MFDRQQAQRIADGGGEGESRVTSYLVPCTSLRLGFTALHLTSAAARVACSLHRLSHGRTQTFLLNVKLTRLGLADEDDYDDDDDKIPLTDPSLEEAAKGAASATQVGYLSLVLCLHRSSHLNASTVDADYVTQWRVQGAVDGAVESATNLAKKAGQGLLSKAQNLFGGGQKTEEGTGAEL